MLEPEAAALYCQKEILDASKSTSDELISHYLVVDCGGGTVDIVAHKLTKTPNGKVLIEEIHQAHGGPHGGFIVNDEFEKMLQKLFQLTKEGIDEVKHKFPRAWVNLIHKEFEYSKCQCDSKSSTPITINLSHNIPAYVEKITGKEMSQLIEEYTHHKLEWDDEEVSLVLRYSTIYSLFAPVIAQIIMVIQQVLKKPECQCITEIFLVGGFAESNILFEEVTKAFSPAIKVKKSQDPTLSVLYGAIIYAQNRNIIKSRKMCQSIGIETWDDFDSNVHDKNRKLESGGKVFCRNVFTKFVEINESVNTETQLEYNFPVASKDQDSCCIRIFGSRHNKTYYTDEEGCYEVGEIIVADIPKGENGKLQEVQVALDVSGTEIIVSAYCNGKTKKLPVTFDCVKDKYTEKK